MVNQELWFAKAIAGTQDGAVLGRVVLLRLSPRQSKKTLEGTNPSARVKRTEAVVD
jgi:hypothetical protein